MPAAEGRELEDGNLRLGWSEKASLEEQFLVLPLKNVEDARWKMQVYNRASHSDLSTSDRLM